MKFENEEIGDLETVQFLYDKDDKMAGLTENVTQKKSEIRNVDKLYGFRVANIVSLSVLFVGYTAAWVYALATSNMALLFDFFQSTSHHFQMDFIFFHICWVFILSIY